ncbi:hypothetical protein C8258_11405 [Nocardia sp. MDA0666]|uniref:DUF6319 family protein n=1 Tax=Nocardia sp. MDA0666 TaxID=2135448 RepID=UPI000D120C5D|nr:DUF6319 family protein [Nocardia sp. MDA0666]PSR68399.1 hypothetical protein C8258_11405 [Nocardia sp. MDA0666]
MSSPRTKPQPLSDTEIRQIAAELADGRPPMVWFTPAAVGVSEGRSGKVIALGDPADGDFLQVRPTGSKDVMSFSPTEVTLAKPARKDKRTTTSETTGATPPATRKDTAVSMSSSVTTPPAPPTPAAVPAAASKTPAPQPASDPKPAAKPAATPARTPREKPAAAARKSKAPEVTVTLAGTADGEWTVDVVHGKKRTIKGLSVPGASVAQAAKLLHPEVAEVVDSVLDAVRDSQRAKVEQLQAELEQARRLLDELSG